MSSDPSISFDPNIAGNDLELCVFVTHEKTGSLCAIYRSLEKKRVEGVDDQDEDAPKVHVGFR